MKLGPLVLIGGFRTGEHGEQRCAAFIDFVALEIELDFHSNSPASEIDRLQACLRFGTNRPRHDGDRFGWTASTTRMRGRASGRFIVSG